MNQPTLVKTEKFMCNETYVEGRPRAFGRMEHDPYEVTIRKYDDGSADLYCPQYVRGRCKLLELHSGHCHLQSLTFRPPKTDAEVLARLAASEEMWPIG